MKLGAIHQFSDGYDFLLRAGHQTLLQVWDRVEQCSKDPVLAPFPAMDECLLIRAMGADEVTHSAVNCSSDRSASSTIRSIPLVNSA
jgi:hypothetical protein